MIPALVPIKALRDTKGRLAALLSDDERRRLSLAMLEDVVGALRSVPRIEQVTVVSPDSEALDRAAEVGAEPFPEPSLTRGINQALDSPAAALVEGGAQALLVVLGDVPTARPEEIEAVLDAIPERGVVIAPTLDRGTAALALRPPGVIPFRFGNNSSILHKREAAASAVSARVLRLPSLSRDIDGPDDLSALLAQPSETATHRLLDTLRVGERLGVGRLA